MINILETEENAIIIENARDYYKLLNKKYLQIIKNWEKILTTLPGKLCKKMSLSYVL